MGWIHYLGRSPSRAALLRGEVPRWIANSRRAGYIARVLLSAPPWVDLDALRALAAEAQRMTALTGRLHVLDHEIPLSHPRVCGLTVPWNIRVRHWRANASKGNRWTPPEQLELFPLDPFGENSSAP